MVKPENFTMPARVVGIHSWRGLSKHGGPQRPGRDCAELVQSRTACDQFRLLSTSARCLIHGIISRSLAPTCSIGCSASLPRIALNEV
jgi:hypothetical protein